MEIEKDVCPVVKVDGFIEEGKQFDIEIVVPNDNRNVIYGVLKDECGEVISDAVINMAKKKEDLFLILSLIKTENLFLDLFVLTHLMKYKFGLTELNI